MSNAKEAQEAINRWLYELKESINKQLPCIINKVNDDGTVDCLVIRNDSKKDIIFPSIPVKHTETQRAYFFLGLTKGDKGVVRFFDRSVEEYKFDGNTEFNNDNRQHSLSDSLFELGFVPASERYAFPNGAGVEIGLKDQSAKINLTDGKLQIICQSADIIASGECNVDASVVNVNAGQTNLGQSGLPIARQTDPVVATDGVTVIGSIQKGGVNTSI